MTKNSKWISGEITDDEKPEWEPLEAVIGSLAEWFMWMYAIVLKDGSVVHAYKHVATRSYLHLDDGGAAYVYQHRNGGSMYRQTPLAQALTAVFDGWEDLAPLPSLRDRALMGRFILAADLRQPEPAHSS